MKRLLNIPIVGVNRTGPQRVSQLYKTKPHRIFTVHPPKGPFHQTGVEIQAILRDSSIHLADISSHEKDQILCIDCHRDIHDYRVQFYPIARKGQK